MFFLLACDSIDLRLDDTRAEADADTDADTAPLDTDGDTDTEIDDTAADTDTSVDTGPLRSWTPGPTEVLVAPDADRVFGLWLYDHTGDGRDDLVTNGLFTRTVDGVGTTELRLSVHPNLGDGTFGPAVITEGTEGGKTQQPSMVDLDGDGHLDALVADRELGFSVFFGSSKGFGPEVLTAVDPGDYPMAVQAGDLDGDGVLEIVLVTQTAQARTRIDVFEPDEAWGYTAGWTAELETVLLPNELIRVDLDGDGRDTIVFGDAVSEMFLDYAIQTVDDAGTDVLSVEPIADLRTIAAPMVFGCGTDTDGDGDEELLSVNLDGLQVYEDARATVLRPSSAEDSFTGITTYDLNGDGRRDVLELLDHVSSSLLVRLSWNLRDIRGFAEATSADYTLVPGGASVPPVIAAGAVDDDGCADVVFLDGERNVQLAYGVCGD